MKFAKEIEDDAVPEWRDKYFNYKVGKKLIKQVARASRELGTSPSPLIAESTSSSPLLLPLPEPALDLPARKRSTSKVGNRLRDYVANSAPNSISPSAKRRSPQARAEQESRKRAFVAFLDSQYEMVEDFYRGKEEESSERLGDIREQLHLLRAQRTRERSSRTVRARQAMAPVSKPLRSAVKRVRFGAEPSKRSAKPAANVTPVPSDMPTPTRNHQADYVRKNDMSYAHAKRHLKRAMVEFYRSLELLKSYALVNHKAFRKVNKKYDKSVNERQPMRYFNERIAKAYFVRSEVVDSHIKAVEDLYARYFAGDSRKVAVGKLRGKYHHQGSYTWSVFRNGFMASASIVFGVEALYDAGVLLFHSDDATHTQTSYLLQIYAGYFLMLLLMILFAACCSIFEQAKINYVFVFELDVRNNIDWRQMFELPSFFFLLLSLAMLLNFKQVGGPDMYVYWPVVLIGLTVLLIFLPVKYFYWRPRLWFLNTVRRLVVAPLPRVEFRDFFLGDMFCSQAYAMGNIELFFCLYARDWIGPEQCNSSNSRLLGFFSALPGVWRLLQCFRRYYDTRNAFPHLVNGGKYTFTFMQYASLSMFRISHTNSTFAAFVAISTINSIYCFIWDVLMDWSLGDPNARHKYLRPKLGYGRVWWVYYLAIFEDLVLRFTWIFYAIFRHDVQHSAFLSFIVGLAEVCRRGIWVLFRVENEHCANLVRNRATKDFSLPYEPRVAKVPDHQSAELDANMTDEEVNLESAMSMVRRSTTRSTGSLRSRRGPSQPSTPTVTAKNQSIGMRVGQALSRAHTQDFERRRDDDPRFHDLDDDDEDDDDDDEEDDDSGEVSEESGPVEEYERHLAAASPAEVLSNTTEDEDKDDTETERVGSDVSSTAGGGARRHLLGQTGEHRDASSAGSAASAASIGSTAVQVQVKAGRPRAD